MIKFIKNICNRLGNNNKSIYPVVAIATANGIFRPTFTMLKKGENPESKKYAALREGITEAIAVPTYWACGELAAKCGKFIASKAEDIRVVKLEKKGKTFTNQVKLEMKNSAIKNGQTGLMLIGVCAAAGIVIPALCSLIVTPVMKKISPKNIQKPNNVYKTYIKPQNQISRPVFSQMTYSGMKVGGL